MTRLQVHTLSEGINHCFSQSIDLGKIMLLNIIIGYKEFLKIKNPGFIPSMSICYREFVLQLFNEIEEPFKYIASTEILTPSKIEISL
jgi:hypothetical protein